jgi:hypothetical protein
MNKPIVTKNCIDELNNYEDNFLLNLDKNEEFLSLFKPKIFYGLIICVSGYNDKIKKKIKFYCNKYDATYNCDLNKHCKILISNVSYIKIFIVNFFI